jgi:transposase
VPAKLKLTYALVEQIAGLKRDGLCDADIIAAIGVHQATFYRWLKEGEDARTGVKRALCDELKKAEAQYKRSLLTTIKSAAESRAQYWTAAAWLLERKYPMEYGRMERKADDAKDAPVQLTLGLVIEPMADDADEGAAQGGDADGD